MTNEEKQLLLIDLSARLPYGVKIERTYVDYPTTLYEEDIVSWKIGEIKIKPYLRPLSSMTEEEEIEFVAIGSIVSTYGVHNYYCILSFDELDWLNAHHFDYRGLIEKGLAIEASDDIYKRI